VLLKNNEEGRSMLTACVCDFYESNGQRSAICFLDSGENGFLSAHFLIDRKHVLRYSLGEDRGTIRGAIEVGIGPHYFRPSQFWDFENSERFSMDASTEAVEHNLILLDEFLGYGQRGQIRVRP
jgi:hypothetical protein